MNCEKINKIVSIRKVLDSFGLFPAKENLKTAFYFALDREEKTPSLAVDFVKNKAFDFGTGKSYDVISIVQQMNNCSVSDALQYLQKFELNDQYSAMDSNKLDKGYEILNVKNLNHSALIQYLRSRRVLEQQHLVREIHYQMNGKKYFGIGFFNNSGGVEIRNKYSKICLGKKDVTLVTNQNKKRNEICVFEGFFDYLTYLSLPNVISSNSDFLILNSTAMFFKAEKQLNDYARINLFLDNDLNGKNLTEKIVGKYENVEDCSMLYQNFKDLNEWNINK